MAASVIPLFVRLGQFPYFLREISMRKSGRGAGAVIIGSATVPARWRFSYTEGNEAAEDFKLIVVLRLVDRKRLTNLKKGDWTEVTAGPFDHMPAYLDDIDYNDGCGTVSATFLRMRPPPV